MMRTIWWMNGHIPGQKYTLDLFSIYFLKNIWKNFYHARTKPLMFLISSRQKVIQNILIGHLCIEIVFRTLCHQRITIFTSSSQARLSHALSSDAPQPIRHKGCGLCIKKHWQISRGWSPHASYAPSSSGTLSGCRRNLFSTSIRHNDHLTIFVQSNVSDALKIFFMEPPQFRM